VGFQSGGEKCHYLECAVLPSAILLKVYCVCVSVEAAGGKCLPCVVDVRDEKQVTSAVEEAVKKFGGIDILVNNASAISLTGTLDTEMKRYDLMHGINTRGTFLV
jgi:NADP-dependent 3-hydroxy acid dehydrogenase YdfG